MKPLLVLLILIGSGLGPGYWLYAKLYSGRIAQRLDLEVAEDGRLLSPPFRLDPSLQPVGLVLHAMGSFTPNRDPDKPPKDGYGATLYKDGVVFLTGTLTLPASSVAASNPIFRERLFWLEAAPAGEYHLEIVPVRPAEIKLDQVRLEARAAMREPDGRLVSAGLLALLAGVLGWFLA